MSVSTAAPLCCCWPWGSRGEIEAGVRVSGSSREHEIRDLISHSPRCKPAQDFSAIHWPTSVSEGSWGRLLAAQSLWDIQSLCSQGYLPRCCAHHAHPAAPAQTQRLWRAWTPLSTLGHPTGLSGLSHLCSKQRKWGEMEMSLLNLGR